MLVTGDLVALGRDGDLPQHGPGGVVERGDQVRGDRVRRTRTAHGLTVERDHPPAGDDVGAGPHERPDHPVQQISIDPCERAPDRRLRRSSRVPTISDTQPCQGRPGLTGDPFADRGERLCTGQDRRQTHRQNHRQLVADPARVPRVRHRPEQRQQLRPARRLRGGRGGGRR